MSNHAVVTLGFTRPVYAHELRPGDVFTLPDAPHTPFTVADVKKKVVSRELTLLALALIGHPGQVHLPATTVVRPLRMVRTVALPCLLCGSPQDVELDLPRDGEPLSLVCGDHVPEQGRTPEGE